MKKIRLWVDNFANKQSGSVVVEASLVLPIIFFCIVALLYFALLLYQTAYLQSLADRAVEAGKRMWENAEKDLATGYVAKGDLNKEGLYWNLTDLKKDDKIDKLETYIEDKGLNEEEGFNVLQGLEGGGKNIVEVRLTDYGIYKKLTVTVESYCRIPLGGMLKAFGINDFHKVEAEASSVLSDPPGLIRNIDFLFEVEGELEEKYPVLEERADQIRGTLGAVKEKIFEMLELQKGDGYGT